MNKLFNEFAPVSKQKWSEQTIKDLKGADFEKKLVWQTYDQFPVQPFYCEEDLIGLEEFVQFAGSVQK